jgi:hypothetical protein
MRLSAPIVTPWSIQVEPAGVVDQHAVLQVLEQDALLHDRTRDRQVGQRVDAQGLAGVPGLQRRHLVAAGDEPGDDVGQVVLALGVLGLQPLQRRNQLRRVEAVEAGVDLVDRALAVAAVAFLADADQPAVAVAQDAAEPGRVLGKGGQHRARRGAAGRAQRAQRRRGDQRAVAVGDQHVAVEPGQLRHRHLHRVAGAERRALVHELQPGPAAEALLHAFPVVVQHHDRALGLQRSAGVQRAGRERAAAQGEQHFGGAHLGALPQACGKAHDGQRSGHGGQQ